MTPEETRDPEAVSDKIIKKTPWWAISVGLHSAAVLLLTFFWVVSDAEPITDITVVRKVPRTPDVEFRDPMPVPSPVPIQSERQVENPTLTRETEEKNQTLDFEEFEKPKGDPEFASTKPFRGKGANDAIGGGGGGGGRKGGPFGGRKLQLGNGVGGPTPDDAVLAALKWLSRHQNPDGSWGVQGYVAQCGRIHAGRCTPNPDSASADFDAVLGAGFSHLSKDTHDGICFGDVVRKGLQWFVSHQDVDGFLGPRTGHKEMYNHAIGALALTEAYGLTGSPLFKDNAQKSIDYLIGAQNPARGWRYSAKCGDNDTSVSGWAIMALKSADLSGIPFPRSAYDGAKAWLDEVTEDSYGRVGYTFKGTGKVFCAHNQHFDHQEALTAISVMSRIFIEHKADSKVKAGAELLMRDLPTYGGGKTDFYAWYYQALALFQFDGPSGPMWTRWSKSMLEAVVKPQNVRSSGCKDGSWEPVDRWGCEGGRVYATAINALTLEVFYRYENVLGGKRK
jgi:hypothetical protein